MGLNRWRRMLVGLALVGSLHPGLAGVSLAGEETAQKTTSPPPSTLALSLRGALDAAVDNNPDVLLAMERIEASRGQVQTQLGTMLPNLSSNIRQSRQTVFRGTFGLQPTRSDPFSIADVRLNASQNLFSLSLIQRWRRHAKRSTSPNLSRTSGSSIRWPVWLFSIWRG